MNPRFAAALRENPWARSASRIQSSVDWLLAIGVLLALETQLRSATSAAGPGEVFLVAWIGGTLAHQAIGPDMGLTRANIPVCVFWAVFAFAQCLGMIQTIASGALVDVSLVMHDVFADGLVAAICLILAFDPGAGRRLREIQWRVILAGALLTTLQLANAADLFSLDGVDPWYWDRMRGWCANPNQFALLCLLIAFCSLSFVETETGVKRATAIVCCGLALVGGWFARSNAYVLVVAAGMGFFAAVKVMRWLLLQERRQLPALPFAAAVVAILAYLGLILIPLGASPANLVLDAGSVARDSGNDLEGPGVRIELWKHALHRSANSFMLGYGPGPHLEIPNIVMAGRRSGDDPKNMQHPKDGAAPNFEAHNTVLELLVQGGLIAVLDYLWIVALAIWRSWRAGADGLTAALLAFNGFGSFHVVFRHPFIWLIMCSALAAAAPQTTQRARQATHGRRPLARSSSRIESC